MAQRMLLDRLKEMRKAELLVAQMEAAPAGVRRNAQEHAWALEELIERREADDIGTRTPFLPEILGEVRG